MIPPLILSIALFLDAILGEPNIIWRRVPHPAILMGRAVAGLEHRLNTGTHKRWRGAACVCVLAIGAIGLGGILQSLQFGAVWTIIGGAVLIAQRSLAQHVRAVADGLRSGLDDGRQAVAMIVGRDTSHMDQPAVARAAIESAAENLSDGVVAPVFWFVLGGLPGILLYKVINTADSMIGHRTTRYADFGWAAARLDDLLNWIPARLTAVTIVVAWGLRSHWFDIVAEARRHRSPNAGWPEAATARALDVALSGPRSYHGRLQDFAFINPQGRKDIGADDIDRAVTLLWRVWAIVFAAAMLLTLLTV